MADPTTAELERALRDAVTEWRESQSDLDYEPARLSLRQEDESDDVGVSLSGEIFEFLSAAVDARRRPRRLADRAELGPNMLVTLGQMHVQERVWAERRFG